MITIVNKRAVEERRRSRNLSQDLTLEPNPQSGSSPNMISDGILTTPFIGTLSSRFETVRFSGHFSIV